MQLSSFWRFIGIAAASMALFAGSAQAVSTYDATVDFSGSANANGVWSYGTTGTSLSGNFALYTFQEASLVPYTTGTAAGWNMGDGQLPWVAKTGAAGMTCCGSVQVPANTLTMHPGAAGEYAVIRFTAPTAGLYQVSASFWGQDNAANNPNLPGTTTDVHVHVGSVDVFSGAISGFGPGTLVSYTGVLSLAAGSSIDLMVGYGSNNLYYNESTGVAATITAVPEPQTIALMLAGLGMVGFVARRRA